MDNSPVAADSWSARTAVIAVTGLGGLALLALAWLSAIDAGGRALMTAAALLLLGYSAITARSRPRLAVDGDALVMRGVTGVQRVPRGHIVAIAVSRTVRITTRSTLLEIDFLDDLQAEKIRVFSRWDLGTAPEEVYERLRELDFVPPTEATHR